MPNATRDRGEYMREYQNRWMQKRRADWIESQGGVCTECGSDDRLEVDHIDPTTKLCNPRSIWSRSHGFRDMELAKCQVLCRECHIEKSRAQFLVTDHGTSAVYGRGCRCVECRGYNASRRREWRASRRALGLSYS